MYIFYLLRHKFWVMYFCFKHGLFWRGIVHDWDKLVLPSMISVYSKYYPRIREIRNTDGYYNPCAAPPDYQMAILAHFNRSRHHWQHWVMPDGSGFAALDMGETDVREMICDWAGAGRTRQKKKWTKASVRTFFEKTRDKMMLSENTVKLIEKNLDSMGF